MPERYEDSAEFLEYMREFVDPLLDISTFSGLMASRVHCEECKREVVQGTRAWQEIQRNQGEFGCRPHAAAAARLRHREDREED